MDYNSEAELEALSHVARDASAPREDSAITPAASPSPSAMDDGHPGDVVPTKPSSNLSTLREEEFMAANTVLSPKLEEEGHGYFHWEIDNWMALPERAVSQTFTVAGHDWDILLFPRGNQASETVSLYIECKPKEVKDDKEAGSGGPDEWHSCALFTLAVSNVDDPEVFKVNSASHRFTAEETDWGFTRFSDIRHLLTPADEDTPALIANRRVRISAYVRVVKDPLGVLWHNFHNYNSRKHTGYVGLRNQGATCYMNSLLQSLYFTNEFRNAVYQIPTEADDPKKSVALALQRVFHSLQVSNDAVDTTELTKSFGWDSLESFMQHDVQEFNRVLQDNLETKMKGTVVDGAVAKLFEGKMKSYIRCVNVDYESSRVENYYDISLNVKGCNTLRDSFANYCEVETLNGENKYQAEGFGLQDAKKGVIFESFPPVLQLQLKRFEYDFRRDAMVKINDRHEFPPTIDLGEFLSDDADRSQSWNYVLHGVLVHSGDLHGGHYFGLLRPNLEEKWYRFDDDRVVPICASEVFEEFYGGDFGPPQPHQHQPLGTTARDRPRPASKRFTNAYMLVYIREALRDSVLCPGDAPIPQHLLQRIQDEKDEVARKQREKLELASTLIVKVVGDDNFEQHQGFDLCYFDQRQPASNALFCERMPRAMTLAKFKATYADYIGRSVDDFRLWSMVGRVNKTIRCDAPLVAESLSMTLMQLKENKSGKWPELRLYCEMRSDDVPDDFDAKIPSELSLVHMRFYDPSRQQVTGVGHTYVHANQTVRDLMPRLREAAVLSPDTPITVFEEVKPLLIDLMDPSSTFRKAEIATGDIICFQVSLEAEQQGNYRLPTVADYFDDMHHRVCVRFVPVPARSDVDNFSNGNGDDAADDGTAGTETLSPVLHVSSKSLYDDVSYWLAEQLGMRDPLKLRFYNVAPTGQQRSAVRRTPTTTLGDMLSNSLYSQPPFNSLGVPEYTVMYERLEVDILQIESMRGIRVTYVGKSMKDELQLEVLVPKAGPAQKLIEATYSKVENALRSVTQRNGDGAPPKAFNLRLYTVASHRVDRVLDGSERMSELGNPGVSDIVAEYQSPESNLDVIPPAAAAAAAAQEDDGSRMDTDDVVVFEKSCTEIEVFHFYRELNHAHSVPFLFKVYPGELWPATWARLERKLGLGEKELKNLGVVYGAQGVQELRRCRVIQDGEGGASPGSGQGTPSVTPPPPQARQPSAEDVEVDDGTPSDREMTTAVDNNSTLCLWDVIQQTRVEEQQRLRMMEDDPNGLAQMPAMGPPAGFLGLHHIDRSSRHRGAHHERAIRILN
ncbi:ubiquitin-specific protease ubp15 [Coemansia sp. S3946]|nr:ubiquitin-specific protease ubp15 [Coemansia sp. S680]KAJ2041557.1 ubiquitin-specific protease ubp15 [Coemansia sp. S3946]